MTDVSKLTASSLRHFLELLDSDSDRAALAYERLHERTAGLLQWWGACDCDGLASETLDRVARRLGEGVPVTPSSLASYTRGVARMVFYESRRDRIGEPLARTDIAAPQTTDAAGPLECLDRCLSLLEPAERRLALRYYDDQKIETRRRLAGEMKISMTALRIRMHRLRARLEVCVSGCVKRLSQSEHP